MMVKMSYLTVFQGATYRSDRFSVFALPFDSMLSYSFLDIIWENCISAICFCTRKSLES